MHRLVRIHANHEYLRVWIQILQPANTLTVQSIRADRIQQNHVILQLGNQDGYIRQIHGLPDDTDWLTTCPGRAVLCFIVPSRDRARE